MPHVFWLTGLPAAGKTTLAEWLIVGLKRQGRPCLLLDGDTLRAGLNRDLGFSATDRDENVRRTAEIAKLAHSQGLDVVCSLVSPFARQRATAREIIGAPFFEVFVDCPTDICRQRDPKGLWALAEASALDNFTGIGQAYERPIDADFHYRSDQTSPMEASRTLLNTFEDLP